MELPYTPAEPTEPAPKSGGGSKSRGSKANATYTEMITNAIVDMNDRTGSSTPAITQWIVKNYPKLKVKATTVGGKIRPLVASGYLERHKSSFKLSTTTKDTLRKAKAATASKKKNGTGGGGKKDSGLDRISRVRKHLGLLPLISDHTIFEENTQAIAEHAVSPAGRDDLAAAPPKKKRRTAPKKAAGRASAAGGNPAAGAAVAGAGSSGGGGGGMMRGSARAKSAYNFYQDSVKATIRREQPGIGMADLRKEMMARWSVLSVDEKAPYEQQGAVAREMFNAMQAEAKQAAGGRGGGGGGGGGGFGGGTAHKSPQLGATAPATVGGYAAPSSLGGGGGSAPVESSRTQSPDDPFAPFNGGVRGGGGAAAAAAPAANGGLSGGMQSMAVEQGAGAAGLGADAGAVHGAEGSPKTPSTWGGPAGANGQGQPTGPGGAGEAGGGPTW